MVLRQTRRDPLETWHWRWVRFYLTMFGVWPKVALGEPRSRLNEAYHSFLVVQTLAVMYSQTHYIVSHYTTASFFELGHMLVALFLNCYSHVRIHLKFDKAFGPMMNKFFTKMHLSNDKLHDAYSLRILEKIERFSSFLTIYYVGLLNSGCPLFSIITWTMNYVTGSYHNPENVTLVSAVYLSTPFDTEHNVINWAVMAIYILYFTYTVAAAAMLPDLCLYLMTFHVMGRILILGHNLTTMVALARKHLQKVTYAGCENEVEVEMFTEEENAEVYAELKRFINEYKFIQAFIRDIAGRYNWIFMITYLYYLFGCCIVLLELAGGGKAGLIQYAPLATGIFVQLILLSTIMEHVCTLSSRLADAVYSTPWQCMNTSNRKTVLLFLMQVQTPVEFKGMGIFTIGVNSMAGILKTTVSYFAFLRTLD